MHLASPGPDGRVRRTFLAVAPPNASRLVSTKVGSARNSARVRLRSVVVADRSQPGARERPPILGQRRLVGLARVIASPHVATFAQLFVVAHVFMALFLGTPILLGRMSRSSRPMVEVVGRVCAFFYFLADFTFRFVMGAQSLAESMRNPAAVTFARACTVGLAFVGLWVAADIVRGAGASRSRS